MLTGPQLKQLREIRGISQGELSRLTGVAQSAISEFEHEKIDMRMSSIERLLDALNVKVQFIVGETVVIEMKPSGHVLPEVS